MAIEDFSNGDEHYLIAINDYYQLTASLGEQVLITKDGIDFGRSCGGGLEGGLKESGQEIGGGRWRGERCKKA